MYDLALQNNNLPEYYNSTYNSKVYNKDGDYRDLICEMIYQITMRVTYIVSLAVKQWLNPKIDDGRDLQHNPNLPGMVPLVAGGIFLLHFLSWRPDLQRDIPQ